jgi:hypothetical protein
MRNCFLNLCIVDWQPRATLLNQSVVGLGRGYVERNADAHCFGAVPRPAFFANEPAAVICPTLLPQFGLSGLMRGHSQTIAPIE